jgi:hypothetical protein
MPAEGYYQGPNSPRSMHHSSNASDKMSTQSGVSLPPARYLRSHPRCASFGELRMGNDLI